MHKAIIIFCKDNATIMAIANNCSQAQRIIHYRIAQGYEVVSIKKVREDSVK